MRSLRPLIAGYLVLCLAFASAVGLSPFLHQLIEHGGHGEWHTHAGTEKTIGLIVGSVPPEWQTAAPLSGESKQRVVLTRNHRPFKLPVAQFARLVNSVANGLGGAEQPLNPDGHEHHSLAQLLASGLLDQHIETPVLAHFVPSGSYLLLSPDELLLASIWNAQTPDRGPPVCVS